MKHEEEKAKPNPKQKEEKARIVEKPVQQLNPKEMIEQRRERRVIKIPSRFNE
jgi:hypothetical protein